MNTWFDVVSVYLAQSDIECVIELPHIYYHTEHLFDSDVRQDSDFPAQFGQNAPLNLNVLREFVWGINFSLIFISFLAYLYL